MVPKKADYYKKNQEGVENVDITVRIRMINRNEFHHNHRDITRIINEKLK